MTQRFEERLTSARRLGPSQSKQMLLQLAEDVCQDPSKSEQFVRTLATEYRIPPNVGTASQLCELILLPSRFQSYHTSVDSATVTLNELRVKEAADGCQRIDFGQPIPHSAFPSKQWIPLEEVSVPFESRRIAEFGVRVLQPYSNSLNLANEVLHLQSHDRPIQMDKLAELQTIALRWPRGDGQYDNLALFTRNVLEEVGREGPYLGKLAAWRGFEPARQLFSDLFTAVHQEALDEIALQEDRILYRPRPPFLYLTEKGQSPDIVWVDRDGIPLFQGSCPPTAAQLQEGVKTPARSTLATRERIKSTAPLSVTPLSVAPVSPSPIIPSATAATSTAATVTASAEPSMAEERALARQHRRRRSREISHIQDILTRSCPIEPALKKQCVEQIQRQLEEPPPLEVSVAAQTELLPIPSVAEIMRATYAYDLAVSPRRVSRIELERMLAQARIQQWTNEANLTALAELLRSAGPFTVYFWQNALRMESGQDLVAGERFGPYATEDSALKDAQRYFSQLTDAERAHLEHILYPWVNSVYEGGCCQKSVSPHMQLLQVASEPAPTDWVRYSQTLQEGKKGIQSRAQSFSERQYLLVALPWNEALRDQLSARYEKFRGRAVDTPEQRREFISQLSSFLVLRWNALLTSTDGRPHLPVLVENIFCTDNQSPCWAVTVAVYDVSNEANALAYVEMLSNTWEQLRTANVADLLRSATTEQGSVRLTPLGGSEVRADFQFTGLSPDVARSAVQYTAGLLQHQQQLLDPGSKVSVVDIDLEKFL